MSFDNKDYPNRKDRRRPYYGSKRFDRSCRSHGSCPWCSRGRQHSTKRRTLEETALEEDAESPLEANL